MHKAVTGEPAPKTAPTRKAEWLGTIKLLIATLAFVLTIRTVAAEPFVCRRPRWCRLC